MSVARLEAGDVELLDRQGAGVLRRVEEDGRDQAAQDDAAAALVGDEGDVLADMPEDRVAGRLARRSGAHDVAHKDDPAAFGPEAGDRRQTAREPGQPHGQGMEGDVGPGRGMLGRGEVVGVDLAVHLEDGQVHCGRKLGPGQEPLPRRPRLEHGAGGLVSVGPLEDGLEGAVDQDGGLERGGGPRGQVRILEELHQRGDVVAAQHGPEHEDGLLPGHGRGLQPPFGHTGQPGGLDLGGRVDTGGHAVPEQTGQQDFLAGGGGFEVPADFGRLLGRKRQRRDALSPPLGFHLEIAVQHGSLLGSGFSRGRREAP